MDEKAGYYSAEVNASGVVVQGKDVMVQGAPVVVQGISVVVHGTPISAHGFAVQSLQPVPPNVGDPLFP
jgi:hypothetical protein